MERSCTSNHPRAKSWHSANQESKSVTSSNRESTSYFSLGHHGHNVAGHFCRISSRRGFLLETRHHTKWLASGAPQPSMSMCALKTWLLLLCFLLSTAQLHAVRIRGEIQGVPRRGEYYSQVDKRAEKIAVSMRFLDLD
jgi:hypothetical protein